MPPLVRHYFDYKSPYAYLAQEQIFQWIDWEGVEVDFLPYTLDIPSYLGAAELDEDGNDLVGTRNQHQWRRVRYAYMDCRREASRRGLVIRGPRKIFDSSLAHIGFLFAKANGSFRAYHMTVFERFWKRELDIESPVRIRETLENSGVAAEGFEEYARGAGRAELESIRREAEAAGVFGVPSFLVGDELFWGSERMGLVRQRLG